MKFILLYLLILSQTFAQDSLLNISSDSIPPLKIGNKWLFNVEEYDNGITLNYKMTKEIVDTLPEDRYVINTKKYFENNIIDSVEYWIWQDSSYSQSQYINGTGTVLYKIGQENYYISQYPNTWQYTNIIDTIFNIISEGAIYSHSFHINLYSSSWGTTVALKVGLYEYYSSESGDGNYSFSNEKLIGIRINNIVYGDTTYLITHIIEPIYIANNFQLIQNFPNPFNPNTLIKYSIPKTGFVSLKIFNVLGNNIATLVNSEKASGNYQVEFNATNLSSGIYFYRMEYDGKFITKKMLFIK
jgi:hypothetical protein